MKTSPTPDFHHGDDHDRGLTHDLQALARQAGRRRALQWLGAGATLAAGGIARAASTCSLIPEETAGPFPGDGSNNGASGVANALMLSGIVRSDIRTSVGSASGTAPGVPLAVQIQLVNTNIIARNYRACPTLGGYAVYVWHCTRDGLYSMYNAGVTSENFLRGVQVTDGNGQVTFQTVFPGCYAGRMPHIHIEVYRSANTATSYSNKLRTTQMAFPVAWCQQVYNNTAGYEASITNLSRISFATDMVFSDGVTTQLATMGGTAANGTATLQIGIAV